MRVGIATDVTSRGASSFSFYLRNLYEHLSKIAPSSAELVLTYNGRICERIPQENQPKAKIHASLYSLLSYFSITPLRLRKHKFDVIHVPHLAGGAPPPPSFFMTGTPIAATLHGVAPFAVPPQYYFDTRKARYLYRCLQAYFVFIHKMIKKRTDFLLITVSNSEKELLQHYLPVSERVRVIYHGVNHTKFQRIRNKAKAEAELLDRYKLKSPYIFHVSSYHPKKNVQTLLNAFYSLKRNSKVDVGLALAGHNPNMQKLVKRLKALGLEQDVRLLGYVPEEDLVKLYNCAELFAFPSLHESFGLPIIEAMACGTPVVASDSFAIPEVAGDAAVLVNPLDVDRLADAMINVLADDRLKADLSQRGKERARLFSWEKCAQEHLAIYEELENLS
ncbi:MAG: glycosyltransferase family 4 protein [Candidatus Bathyarchaeota archaeon]|nr:MAG: glycosyltransferase family 4 protein [Candidatus Bathyarchaeota archaeon]